MSDLQNKTIRVLSIVNVSELATYNYIFRFSKKYLKFRLVKVPIFIISNSVLMHSDKK